MKALLDFISNNGFGIIMFILFFGGVRNYKAQP